jgi:hypothetical protein
VINAGFDQLSVFAPHTSTSTARIPIKPNALLYQNVAEGLTLSQSWPATTLAISALRPTVLE